MMLESKKDCFAYVSESKTGGCFSLNELYCRNTPTCLLHYSTNITTLLFFLQKMCFYYNVEN